MKILKISVLVFLAILVILQFFPPEFPANSDVQNDDLLTASVVPAEVGLILKTSCYDCHSSQVNYPWYSKVAPVSWLVARDVRKGIEELNFSEWNTYNKRKMIKKLEEIGEEVEGDKMPMQIYTMIHWNAKLDENNKKVLVDWARGMSASMLEN